MLPYNHQDMLACASKVVKAGLCGVSALAFNPLDPPFLGEEKREFEDRPDAAPPNMVSRDTKR